MQILRSAHRISVQLLAGCLAAVFAACASSASVGREAALETASGASASKVLNVFVLAYSQPWRDEAYIRDSMKALEERVPGLTVKLERMPHIPLREAIRKGEPDLVVATSSFFAMDPTEKVQPLAALISNRAPDPNRASASAVIVRSDRHLRNIADLKGRSIAAQTEECELGLHYVEHEVAQAGFDPDHFFSSVRRDEPGRMRQIIDDVAQGRVDAGVLRACYLEDLGEKELSSYVGRLKVLNALPQDGLSCLHSTRLYPGIIIAGTSPLGAEHAREVAAALFSMPEGANGSRWGISTDFARTDEMLERLKLGPYEYLREWTPARVWREYPAAVVALAVLAAALLSYGVILRRLVRIRTRALEEQTRERMRLESEARAAAEQMDAVQQAGAVGQLSSIIAHELKQPLEAIQNLSRGTLRIFDDEEDVPARAADAVERIAQESLRASEIIDRVRAYGKGRRDAKRIALASEIEKAVEQFRVSGRNRTARVILDVRGLGDSEVVMDPIDLQLIIVNLLKNAAEAASAGPAPEVVVAARVSEGEAEIFVVDNGPEITDEAFARLGRSPGKTQKASGLGLGLMIVKGLVEAALGQIIFSRAEPHGISVRVCLPIARKIPAETSKQP